MIATSLAEVARIVGGTLDGPDAAVTGPAYLDSRRPEPGGLFVAFVGERTDGHAYAEQAVAGGAAGVLGSRATGVPTVVVDDVQAALGALAREVLRRRRAEAPLAVVAVTGSAGKTSAKDMLAAVLADAGPTVATYGSFNNELGLPLTVLRVEPDTRFLVLEMGARGIGHLTELCAIAPPDVSLVLNVGHAHIGEFGSRANIALAKGELVDALGEAGTAVLNADDVLVSAMRDRAAGRVLTFGRTTGAEVVLSAEELDELGRPTFELSSAGRTERVGLRLLGAHHADNAAAVAATALALGLDLPDVARSLRAITALSKWRMELTERADGVRVVNDAYNANPESMASALRTLGGIGDRTGSRTVAVLGAMRELGDTSLEEHRAVGRLVRELGIDDLVVVGPDAAGIVEGATGYPSDDQWDAPLHAADVHEAAAWLRETVRAPDVVLVKASRGVALERVVAALLETEDTTEEKEADR